MTDAWGGITNPRVLEEGCSYDTATHSQYYKIAFFRYVPDDDFYGHAWATVSHTGGAGGWVDTIDITVLPRNDEPSIDGNLVLTPDPATEDGSILATGLSISDVDLDYYQGNVNDLDYTLQFELEAVGYPDEHPFALEFDNGLSLTDDGNGMWSVTAGFTDINEALTSGLRVDLLDDFHGQVSVTMTVLDNGNIDHFFPQESLTDSINWDFSVQPTYDPPELSDVGGTLAYTEGDGAAVIDAAITLVDTDSTDMSSATIEITAGYWDAEDELGLTAAAAALAGSLGVDVDWDPSTGVLSLTGCASTADYEILLEGVTYTNTSDAPHTNARTVAWTVTDSDGYGSEPASSTITVDPKAGAPTVTLDAVTAIDETGIATVTGTIVDSDTTDTFTLDINWGDPLSPDNVEQYTFGASATGSQTFTLTHRYVDDNPSSTASDTYIIDAVVTDDDFDGSSGSTTVQVNNSAPVFSGTIADQTIAEGGTATVDFTGMFTDVPADTLTFAYQVDGGTWVDLGTSTTFDLTYGDDGTHTVVVRATDDDSGSTSSNDFTITVSNVDPVFTGTIADQTIAEGGTASIDFTGMFTDVPADTLTFAYQVDGGTWVDLGTSTTFDLTYGDDGTHTVVVRATDDDSGTTSSNVFTITVTNLDPVFSGTIADQTIAEGGTANVDFTGMFSDVPADTWTFAYRVDSGSWVDLGTSTTFDLTYGDDGTHTVVVRATDDDSGSTTSNVFTITVTNLDPVFSGTIGDQTIAEGGTASIDFSGMFSDVAGDTLTFAYRVDGGIWVDLGTATAFDLSPGDDGTYSVVVRATDDDSGTTTSNEFTVTVTNLDPVFTGTIGDQTIDEGGTATVDFTGMFSDVPGDTLTFAYRVNGGIWVDLGTSTTFGLALGDDGTHNVVVRALDGDGGVIESNVFTVTAENVAPVVTGPISDCILEEGAAGPGVNLHKCFSDVLGDLPLSFTYDDGKGNAGAVSDPTNFRVQYDNPGDYTVTVTAHDGDGGSRSLSFTVTAKSDPSGKPIGYEPFGTDGPQGEEPQEEDPPVGSYYNGPVFAGGPSSIGPFAFESEEPSPGHPAQQPGGEQPAMPTGGSSQFPEHPDETGDGDSGQTTPPGPGVNVLTGLPGFYENALKGHALVFNLDNVHCTDLCTPLVLADPHVSAGCAGGVTGLSAYLEGIKAGKSLVFNLDEIDCWALCVGG